VSNSSVLSAISKIKSLLTYAEKLKWIAIVGFAFFTSILEMITAVVIVAFAQVLNQPESGQKYMIMAGLGKDLSSGRIVFFMAIACGLIYLIKNIVAASEVFYQNFTIQKMNYHFKNKLLYRYAAADYGFYLTRNSSLGSQVVGGDAEQMFTGAMIPLASILSEGVIFVFLLAMIVYMNPSLALIVFSTAIVLGLLITKILLPQFYRFGQRLQEAALYSGQTLLQFFHGFKEIVLLGKREAFINAYQFHSRKKARVQAIQKAVDSLPRMIIEVLFVGLFVATIAVMCLEHESPVQMIGILGGYLYAGFRLMPGLNRIITQLNAFKAAIPYIERVHAEYNTVGAKENYVDVPGFTFENSIAFKNVNFNYQNTKKKALNNINFEIKKGECIGVVGETGSGKSTLIDLLLGLLLPTSGEILVDNMHPVNSYQWHKKIGYVPQSVYLTDDSIEANIAFGEEASNIDQDRLNKVIDNAQLSKFITQLPNGAKTLVGERGVRLSGGERQRIAIARALYRNPEVLIFDEATSALDNETEARLMETIQVVSKDRTVIMIAHRLSTLKDCDRIVNMDGGVVGKITIYDDLSN
jgi:ABC-type multidrug transport system fused ATPase/permease subunit